MKKLILGIIGVLVLITSYGQDYSEQWTHGSEVEIIATPNPGWEFVNWTDQNTLELISNENPLKFIVVSDVFYVANFQQIMLQLVLNSNNDGGVETGAGVYAWGDEVTITAIPNVDDGWEFVKWVNDIFPDVEIFEQVHTFIIDENHTSFTAHYKLPLYWVNLTINPWDAGMVYGEGTYAGGSDVKLYSEPNINWVFESWENVKTGEIIEANPYVFRIYDDYDFIANFSPETSIVNTSRNEIRIYPNPTKNQLFVETPENSRIKIITLNGRRILINNNLHQTIHQINVGTLPSGVYLIDVEINNTSTFHKFIVE